MLPFAEFLLCDYNYVFSPWHCGVLAGSLGWEPATTLLVADEAHNLPERAAGARSIHCTATEADDALLALRAAGARGKWPKVWTDWLDFLISLEKHDKVSRYVVEEAAEHCARITRLWNDHPPFHYELETPAMDALERPAQLLPFLVETPPNYHIWSPEDRSLRAACLDASTPTGETLREFHRSILMSATIAPVGEFAESVGLQAPAVLPCLAPWRDVAYDVAVDVRVDTRLREREHHYETTAKTILMFAGVEPCVVFFPSYKYAEDVVPYVKLLDESFRVAIQPRGATPDENNAFISDALITAHAIFLIAGGGLAESIDLLGGKLSRAIVVSPCLPEVNAERAAQMRLRTAGGYRDTFENVYLVPALRKVNQALGRLVRAPGQRAKILLHCKRFASPQVNSLLAPEYRPSQVISTVEDLLNFTNKR
jgi:Rad3-related DNA helicase